MDDNESKSTGKDSTLLKILAAIVTIITALTGLIVAFKQSESTPTSSPSANLPTQASPTSVKAVQLTLAYIQIYTESQRGSAAIVRERLNNSGFNATAIEKIKIDDDSPQEATVRYFDQKDLESAKVAKDIVSEQLGSRVQVELLSIGEGSPGTIEIWYPLAIQ